MNPPQTRRASRTQRRSSYPGLEQLRAMDYLESKPSWEPPKTYVVAPHSRYCSYYSRSHGKESKLVSKEMARSAIIIYTDRTLSNSIQLSLPVSSVVEDFKVARCCLVMTLRDSVDTRIAGAGIQTRTGRSGLQKHQWTKKRVCYNYETSLETRTPGDTE